MSRIGRCASGAGTARAVLAAAAIAAAAALAGCAPDDSRAGFGLGTLDAAEAEASFVSAGATPHEVSGALAIESNGCFTWDSDDEADGAWLVWPEGGRHDGDGVVLADGNRVAGGDALSGTGALVALADLPDGANADSYFASYGGFCDAGERGVLVLAEATGK